jgi:glyoxylase-like metal-dependent hydrolase (beta-lactamase superfamily II)
VRHLATGIGYVDLHFVGRAGIIATGVLHGPGGVALIDPGPESCLPVLRRSLADAGVQSSDLRAILLTHIHLDHAGATGTLVREHPAVAVFVSERGAPTSSSRAGSS